MSSISNQYKILLIGISQSDGFEKFVEVHDKEKRSLQLFLGTQNMKNLELEKVIGIGGEGIVVKRELEIEIMQGTAKYWISKKAKNIQLKSKKRSMTAIKFVKFQSDASEDFQGQGFQRCS